MKTFHPVRKAAREARRDGSDLRVPTDLRVEAIALLNKIGSDERDFERLRMSPPVGRPVATASRREHPKQVARREFDRALVRKPLGP